MGLLDAIRKRRKGYINWEERKPIPELIKVVDGKKYSTLDSKLIAQGFMIGFLTPPTFSWMFRTQKDNYFIVSMWAVNGLKVNAPNVHPVGKELAVLMFQSLPFQDVEYSEAFPDQPIVDA